MTERDPSQRVVVTGMGMLSPIGLDVESSWRALLNGEDGIQNIRRTLLSGYSRKKVGTSLGAPVIDGFDLLSQPSLDIQQVRKDRKGWHLSAQYAVAASLEAMNQAGLLEPETIKIDRTQVPDMFRFGVSIGSGIAGAEEIGEARMEIEANEEPRIKPTHILEALPGRPSEVVSMVFGPSYLNDKLPKITELIKAPLGEFPRIESMRFEEALFAECASGNANIASAADHIRLGRADIVVAGGVEATLSATPIKLFEATRGAVDPTSDPRRASRPFHENARGLVMGAGAGILVLESLASARRRGVPVFAELLGYGMSADAYTDTYPSGYGLIDAHWDALRDSNIEPGDVDYINPHATSTLVGDGVELWASGNIYDRKKTGISGTKAATGHMFGGAGAAEAIFCIKAIGDETMPPSIKLSKRSRVDVYGAQDWYMSEGEATLREINIAANVSSGFGGPNYVTIWAHY